MKQTDVPTNREGCSMNGQDNKGESPSRREFLKRSGTALSGAALASALAARSYAGEDNTINVALIGCGGKRG